MTLSLIIIGKLVSALSKTFNLGSGGTWPGEIALMLNPHITSDFLKQLKKGVVIVAGTNGKTTTAKMIQQILETGCPGDKIIHNDSGANLLNGIVSAFIKNASWLGKIEADWAVVEVDENTLPILINQIKKYKSGRAKKIIIVLLNLFRDQLDRYGEVDSIVRKWQLALNSLNSLGVKPIHTGGVMRDIALILNADDPQIAYLGKNKKYKIRYFGLNKPDEFLKLKEHATDSTYCRKCSSKLVYNGIYFSHIGIWYCENCDNKRPEPDLSVWKSPLPGLYNLYNTLAAVLVGRELGIKDENIKSSFESFQPAFGRQEEIETGEKKVKIFLSKNPAGFNASLRTVLELKPKSILLALNDRIPDGRDVSWIWDVDFEMIPKNIKVITTGDRVYDMALRIKYTLNYKKENIKSKNDNEKLKIDETLENAINEGLKSINSGETLYILPTYSAMLNIRKLLMGRKIL